MTENAKPETPCTDHGGTVCDGAGHCVQCVQAADCMAQASACVVSTCSAQHVCGTQNASPGTACTDSSGQVCNASGACVGCNGNGDCTGGDVCIQSQCVAPTCSDQEKDGDETDVDCGGSCPPCPDTKTCRLAADCQSGYCLNGFCSSCASDGECQPSFFCNGQGVCEALLGVGGACTGSDQCTSGYCVDGVCCDSACQGACMACSNALTQGQNGHCTSVTQGTDPKDQCADEASTTCGTTGVCGVGACELYASGTICVPASCNGASLDLPHTCDGAGNCDDPNPPTQSCGEFDCENGTCASTCQTDSDCVVGAYCAAGKCMVQRLNGATCTAADECQSGFCADGFCCNSACNAACTACSAARKGSGADGTCGNSANGQSDPHGGCAESPPCGDTGLCFAGACAQVASGTVCAAPTCTGSSLTVAKTCNGAGACSQGGGTSACPGDLTCESGTACYPACANDSECASGYYCSAGKCEAETGSGSACLSGDECFSGVCDVYCCVSACVTGGVCGATACAPGTGACAYPPAGTLCGSPACTGSTLTGPSECNSTGDCTPGGVGSCPANLACSSLTACFSSCGTNDATGDLKCASGYYCNGAACSPDVLKGMPCTRGTQCLSGTCGGGSCM